MLFYFFLFLVRYFPFWAIPVSLMVYEIGQYYYNRRDRIMYLGSFGTAGTLVILSIIWLATEGYWHAAPWVRKMID